MRHSSPSLNALRAFEAAARLRSFKKASEELNVTPAAISQQIKTLELDIGQKLFLRGYRPLGLTSAGRLIFPEVRNGFEALNQSMQRLRRSQGRHSLKVACAPAFAAKWLVPELQHFSTAPLGFDTDVYVIAAHEIVDYERDHIDIGIRYGRGLYRGLASEQLFSDALCPVCSPKLRISRQRLRTPKDLSRHTLLHDDSLRFDETFPDWSVWLKAFGLSKVDAIAGPRFNTAADAIGAAVQGAGILLTRQSLIRAELASRALIRLFDLDYPLEHGFHVVYRSENLERLEVRAFRDWLVSDLTGPRE